MPQVVGVVLAGGRGERLGEPKGEVVVDGKPLAESAARVLAPLCGTVLISISPGGSNPAPAHVAVEDAPPGGRGPLAGIHAAFEASGSADLLVLACDYPRIETPLLQALLRAAEDEDDLVMLTDGRGRDHPLVGLWRRAVASHVADMLERRLFKVRAMLSDVAVRRLRAAEMTGFDLDRALINVNTTEDLDALR